MIDTERKDKSKFYNVDVAARVTHFVYLEFQGKQSFLTGTVGGTVPGRQADMGTNEGSTSD